MTHPTCPDHGRLVLDLALGRLDDASAARAEEARTSCSVCRRWWREQLSGSAVKPVDDAVAKAFAELELPARRSSRRWMAVAAAVVMTVGVGLLWMSRDPLEPGARQALSGSASVDRIATIQTMDFEQPEAIGASTTGAEAEELVVVAERPATTRPEATAQIIEAEPRFAQAQAPQLEPEETPQEVLEPVFVGGFESGSLNGWGCTG